MKRPRFVALCILAAAPVCLAQLPEIRSAYHIPESAPGRIIRHSLMKSPPGGFTFRLRFSGNPWDTRGFTRTFRREFAWPASTTESLYDPNVSAAETTIQTLDQAAIDNLGPASATDTQSAHPSGGRPSVRLFQNALPTNP